MTKKYALSRLLYSTVCVLTCWFLLRHDAIAHPAKDNAAGTLHIGQASNGGTVFIQGGAAGLIDVDPAVDMTIGRNSRGGEVRIFGGSGSPGGGVHFGTSNLDRVWLDSDGVFHYRSSEVATRDDILDILKAVALNAFLFGLFGSIVGGAAALLVWRYRYKLYLNMQPKSSEGPYRS